MTKSLWQQAAPIAALILWMGMTAGARGEMHYAVHFKDRFVATQTVSQVQSDGLVEVHASFSASLPVFRATHFIREKLTVACHPDGAVESFRAEVRDGGTWREVTGMTGGDGVLDVDVVTPGGRTTRRIAPSDYDFHSLVVYGNDPSSYLPTGKIARVLDVRAGEVVPVTIDIIQESITYERQHIPTRHLIWSEGAFRSHSWHPERFHNWLQRYLRHDDRGEFAFTLMQ